MSPSFTLPIIGSGAAIRSRCVFSLVLQWQRLSKFHEYHLSTKPLEPYTQ